MKHQPHMLDPDQCRYCQRGGVDFSEECDNSPETFGVAVPYGDQCADTDGLARESVFWLGPDGLTENGERMDAPTELRPPPEHAGKPWHWVVGPSGNADVVAWRRPNSFRWDWTGFSCSGSPAEMARNGYRYLGPAEWTPDAETVSRPLMTFWRDIARRHAARIAELEAELAALKAPQQPPAAAPRDHTALFRAIRR